MKVQTFEYCVARDSSTQIFVSEVAVIDVEPEAEAARLANKFGLGVLEHVYGAAFETTLESAIEACAAKVSKPKTVKKTVQTETVDAE